MDPALSKALTKRGFIYLKRGVFIRYGVLISLKRGVSIRNGVLIRLENGRVLTRKRRAVSNRRAHSKTAC